MYSWITVWGNVYTFFFQVSSSSLYWSICVHLPGWQGHPIYSIHFLMNLVISCYKRLSFSAFRFWLRLTIYKTSPVHTFRLRALIRMLWQQLVQCLNWMVHILLKYWFFNCFPPLNCFVFCWTSATYHKCLIIPILLFC